MSLAALLIAQPANAVDPVLLSIYPSPPDIGLYYNVQLKGDIVYMAAFDFFHVVDVSDPTQPSEVAIALGGGAVALEVVGDRVYIAGYGLPSNLRILSVANPAAPVSLGSWELPLPGNVFAYDLEVVGDVVYLVAEPGGLRILDVSALPSIAPLGSLFESERFLSVAVSGSHAYLAAEEDGLFIVDISDPTMPDHVGTIVGSGVTSVDVKGTHLYVGGDQFRIFDVSSSGSPVLVGQAAIEFEGFEGTHLRVNQAEGLAYAGKYVIDVHDVAQPVLAATLPVSFAMGSVRGSDGIDGIVYAPHSLVGLHAFRIFLPPRPRPLPALGGFAAVPLASVLLAWAGWRALRMRGRKRRLSATSARARHAMLRRQTAQ